MKITIVAAIASNNVIGQKNSLPWDIPEDLRRFKQLTSGHTILMGRKTFDSIGRPLPNRTNIVMTKDTNYQKEGIEIVFDENEALDLIKNLNEKVFIIGGSSPHVEVTFPESINIYLKNWSLLFVFSINLFTLDLFELTNQ